MPHERPRLLQVQVQRALRHSPIVGILGQRQVGKTTLMEALVPDERYVSLDRAAQLDAARANPTAFLEQGSALLGVDECQLAPELFPALKERVRAHKKPGQFLLTGSVRFTSRKIIRESLTGRIVALELLPLCLAEVHGFEIGDAARFLRLPVTGMRKLAKERLALVSESRVDEYLRKGGLPGICFFRDPEVRSERFDAQLDTLLRRDIRLVLETSLPYEKIVRALQFLAMNQGKPLAFSELGRFSRISAPSLRKLIPAFEALFLIRRVETMADRRKAQFFLEDQGMATFLAPARETEDDMLRFVFSQCLAQLKYGPARQGQRGRGTIRSYETRGGARVPLVLDVSGELTALIPVALEAPDATAIASARSFLRRHPGAVAAILTRGIDLVPLGSRIFSVPYRAIL